MLKYIIPILIIFISFSTTRVFAVEPYNATNGVNATIGMEQLYGESVYEIGGNFCRSVDGILQGCGVAHFPVSRLEFPLSQTMINFGVEYVFGNFKVYSELKTDVVSQNSTFLDSDWTNFDNPGLKTIYSESTSTAKAIIISTGFEKKFTTSFTKMETFFGAELTYQNFYFEARDTTQFNYFPNGGTVVTQIDGVTITYDVTYIVPKLFIRFASSTEKTISFSYKLSYSPFVNVKDEDQHLARANPVDSVKVSEGDLTGEALEFEFMLNYRISTSSKLQFTYRIVNIKTQGTQMQRQDVDLSNPLDGITEFEEFTVQQEVSSLQQSIGVTFSMTF